MKHLISALLLLVVSVPILPQNDSIVNNSTGLSDSLLLEGIDASFIVNSYIDAIGGRENLAAVYDRTTKMTGEVQGFEVEMTIYQKRPNLLRQEIQAAGIDQLIIFDGEKGVLRMGEEEQKILGDELKKLSLEAAMGLILEPDSAGLKFELAGIRMIEDTRTYKINSTADGISWSSYYSFNNRLKILEEKEVKTPSGKFLQEVYYKDYREVEGIKYPYRIEQKMGQQEMTFTVISIKINQNLQDSLFEID